MRTPRERLRVDRIKQGVHYEILDPAKKVRYIDGRDKAPATSMQKIPVPS